VTMPSENLHEVLCEVATSQVQAQDGMRQGANNA
jgi:hypothetical protein